ncbi:MAG: type II toxin-antitoxin system Phd/YefM family antitoxin [Ruminococcus sp.]|nr:type II toxin-antitoxin system Phd/YefM family antitoxin [Ruminococcus sp.]
MAMIRPSSDLRNHYNEISEFCHRTNQPVYITKNGAGDLVVLSNDDYERLTGPKAELYRLLDEAEKLSKVTPGRPAKEVFAEIEKEFGFDKL